MRILGLDIVHPPRPKSAIKLAHLRDERWIIYQQRTHPLLCEKLMKPMRDEHIHPKHVYRILYPVEAEHLLMASRGVALLTRASALNLDGKRLFAKPLEEDALCLDERIAARGDDNSRLVSEFVRAFDTRPATIANDPADREERLAVRNLLIVVACSKLIGCEEAHWLLVDLADGPELGHVNCSFPGFALVQVGMVSARDSVQSI